VTYGIIKDHGGNIRVESQPGDGATFIITFPVTTGGTPQEDASPESPEDTLPSEDTSAESLDDIQQSEAEDG
jgi:hypothetical protein